MEQDDIESGKDEEAEFVASINVIKMDEEPVEGGAKDKPKIVLNQKDDPKRVNDTEFVKDVKPGEFGPMRLKKMRKLREKKERKERRRRDKVALELSDGLELAFSAM